MIKSILLVILVVGAMYSQQDELSFWDRTELSIIGGPLFPSGEDGDLLSTGFYFGVDGRYQIFRFMAVGISIGRNGWNGQYTFDSGIPGSPSQEGPEISSGKTNVCASLHFGPSAPTWSSIAGLTEEGSINDVKPYKVGSIVPYFIVDIGPYFWDWTETDPITGESYDETGSDTMLRGTLAGFYQASKLISVTLGFSYTMYDFDGGFASTGLFGGLRFNMGQVVSQN